MRPDDRAKPLGGQRLHQLGATRCEEVVLAPRGRDENRRLGRMNRLVAAKSLRDAVELVVADLGEPVARLADGCVPRLELTLLVRPCRAEDVVGVERARPVRHERAVQRVEEVHARRGRGSPHVQRVEIGHRGDEHGAVHLGQKLGDELRDVEDRDARGWIRAERVVRSGGHVRDGASVIGGQALHVPGELVPRVVVLCVDRDRTIVGGDGEVPRALLLLAHRSLEPVDEIP